MANSSTQITMTLYHIDSQNIDAQVLLKDNTIWATQKTIAEIFGVDKSSISKHIANIFNDGELSPHSTIANFAIVQREGNREVSRKIEHYNLDMIISVGYRVNSKKATHFRKMSEQSIKPTHPLTPSAREGEQRVTQTQRRGKYGML